MLEQVGPPAYSTLYLSLPCLSGSILHRHSLSFLYGPFFESNSLGNSLSGATLAPAPFVGGRGRALSPDYFLLSELLSRLVPTFVPTFVPLYPLTPTLNPSL